MTTKAKQQALVLQQVQSRDRIRTTIPLDARLGGEWVVMTVSLAQRFAICVKADNVNREHRFSEYEFNASKFLLVAENDTTTTRKKTKQ